MPSFETYKNFVILSTTPTGDGGQALNQNFTFVADALAALGVITDGVYNGSSNIVVVGTITSGTWNSTIISPQYLGSGSPSSSNFLRGDGSWQTVSGGGGVPTSRVIGTTGSLSGGGDLTADRTLAVSIPQPIRVSYDGVGMALTTGSATKVFVQAQNSGTITANTMLADQSGSCIIAIRKCSFANFPGSLTSIVASAPPTLSSQQKSEDLSITGWTTAITAGDVLEFSITSATTITRLTLVLQITGV